MPGEGAKPPAAPGIQRLPEEFWSTDVLRHIRRAAYSKLNNPDVTLGGVFAFLLAQISSRFVVTDSRRGGHFVERRRITRRCDLAFVAA